MSVKLPFLYQIEFLQSNRSCRPGICIRIVPHKHHNDHMRTCDLTMCLRVSDVEFVSLRVWS